MSNSTRGPQRADSGPRVMYLDQLCRLLADGQRFTIELHPYSDLYGDMGSRVARNTGLHILDGGQVAMLPGSSGVSVFMGATLANYGSLWRCWQGTPGEAQRKGTPWKRQGVAI